MTLGDGVSSLVDLVIFREYSAVSPATDAGDEEMFMSTVQVEQEEEVKVMDHEKREGGKKAGRRKSREKREEESRKELSINTGYAERL